MTAAQLAILALTRRMAKAALLLLGMAAITPAMGATLHLSRDQAQFIAYADRVGGLRLAAIILQESSACQTNRGDHGHAHGCGQMHTDTFRHVAGFKASVWWLDHDPWLSIRAANLYLRECTRLYGYWQGIECFNIGIPAMKKPHTNDYLHRIEYRMNQLQHLPLSES